MMMMSHSSSSRAHSRGTIPFSWENKPGVSKVTYPTEGDDDDLVHKLPPPPCPSDQKAAKISVHDFQIPLPPCAFPPPSRSSSTKGLRKHEDDPFLAAYKECTKSSRPAKGKSFKSHVQSAFRKNMLVFSCTRSSSVRDDNLVRISQLPYDRDNA